MTHLDFADRLVHNTFSNNNTYTYVNVRNTDIRFFNDCRIFPFIMKSGYNADQTTLMYSNHSYQLRNRLLNTAKIKEVMDSSHLPLMFSIKGKWYMIGKGFLAHITNTNNYGESLNLLFVACIDSSKITRTISEVKFYVSRDIYKDDYKAILPAVKDIMVPHTGDVILSSNLNNIIGDKIPFPTGGTLEERKDYKREIVIECIREYFY